MYQIPVKKVADKFELTLPQTVSTQMGLCPGDNLNVKIDGDSLVIKSSEGTLEELLASSRPESFILNEEDKQWLNG